MERKKGYTDCEDCEKSVGKRIFLKAGTSSALATLDMGHLLAETQARDVTVIYTNGIGCSDCYHIRSVHATHAPAS
jgi:hypothetical protein